ncbi:MAG: STAS domain-containing protein [Armatimonadota bacterium]
MVGFIIEHTTTDESTSVISVSGELDIYTAPDFKAKLQEVLSEDKKNLIIDYTSLNYLDSTALGILVGVLKRTREAGKELALVCPSPRVKRLFQLTGLDDVFEIHQSLENARNSFGKEKPTVD